MKIEMSRTELGIVKDLLVEQRNDLRQAKPHYESMGDSVGQSIVNSINYELEEVGDIISKICEVLDREQE